MWECRTIARSPAGSGVSGMADGEKVEGAVEVDPVLAPQREVGCRDRRHETVVERLRDAEGRVDAIPSGRDRELVHAELSGVMEAEQLDSREVRRQKLQVLGGRVFPQVPRVSGAVGAGGSEREPIRGRDVGDRSGGGDPIAEGAWLVDVLDRLQEDDRVVGPLEVLDQAALEPQPRTRVAAAGMLVRL